MRVRALRGRRLPLVLGAAVVAALAAAGCGEKSEPSVQPPVTTGVATSPTTTAPGTTTKSVQTPTAPVPKTTP